MARLLGWKVHLRRAIDVCSAMHLSQAVRSRGAGLYARPELPAFAARVAAYLPSLWKSEVLEPPILRPAEHAGRISPGVGFGQDLPGTRWCRR
jgi:hypothetical protein